MTKGKLILKDGAFVKATWSDGLVVIGIYRREERGYLILEDHLSNEVPCNKSTVSFEAMSEEKGLELFKTKE